MLYGVRFLPCTLEMMCLWKWYVLRNGVTPSLSLKHIKRLINIVPHFQTEMETFDWIWKEEGILICLVKMTEEYLCT